MPIACSRARPAPFHRWAARSFPGWQRQASATVARWPRELASVRPQCRRWALHQAVLLGLCVLALGGKPNQSLAATPPKASAPVTWDILLPAIGVSTNDINWGKGELQDFLKQLQSNYEKAKGSGGAKSEARGIDTNDVKRIVEEVLKRMAVGATDTNTVKGIVQGELKGKAFGGTDTNAVTGIVEEVLKRMAVGAIDTNTVKGIVRGELKEKAFGGNGTNAVIEIVDEALKRKASGGAGLVALLVDLLLVVGFLMWWLLGLGKVLSRAREQLDPKNPGSLRSKVHLELELENKKEGSSSIASRVSALERSLQTQLDGAISQIEAAKTSALAAQKGSGTSPPKGPPEAVATAFSDVFQKLVQQVTGLDQQLSGLVGEVDALKAGSTSSNSITTDVPRNEDQPPLPGAGEDKSPPPAAEAGKGPSAEAEPGVREMIGLCFVDFCSKDHAVYEADEFEGELNREMPGAKVQVGYRPTSAQGPYFYQERPQTSCLKGWVVTLGDSLFLLPTATSVTDFDTVLQCFEMPLGTMPKNLKDCLPANLMVEGKRWGVVKQGRLSGQSNEKLQRWWEARQKPKQSKAPQATSMQAAASQVAGTELQTLDRPTLATVGQEFVQFCKQALRGVDAPKFEDFLEALKRRFPGTNLTGSINMAGSVNVWQVLAGQKEQAIQGWLLPAIKSLNDFHPFGHVFIAEGEPTPETVDQVMSAEIWLNQGGESKTWEMKAGRVLAKKSGDSLAPTAPPAAQGQPEGDEKKADEFGTRTPWEEELIEAVGAAYVKACMKIARKEFKPAPTQSAHQAALANSGLTQHNPTFYPLDIVLTLDPVPPLQQVSKPSPHFGDVWLLRFDKGGEQVLLVTPRLIPDFVRFAGNIAKFFPVEGSIGPPPENIAVGTVTALVPCLVRYVPDLARYTVVAKGMISIG